MNTSITNDGSFFIIAHWSDIHLNSTNSFYSSTINVERKLREAVDHLNKTTPLPNILIITGDLVDYPSLDDYKLFRLIMDGLMLNRRFRRFGVILLFKYNHRIIKMNGLNRFAELLVFHFVTSFVTYMENV